MTQEMNKKAVADLFCIEDARAVCEAIGGLGLNPDNQATDEPLEYTPDNILDVTVNENPDGMPAFPQLGQKELDSETQAFVVDELAKALQADGRESLTDEDLIPFMVKIKGENGISQDLTPFLDQITGSADNRLASQNVSQAQPNGVATDLTTGADSTAPAEPDSLSGMGELPPEAPGGLAEPTEMPALDTNTGDDFNLSVPGTEPAADPAATGDFNLDVPEPGAEVAPEDGADSFNLDVGDEGGEAPVGDGTDTIGELDFGDEGGTDGAEAPAEGGEGGSSEDDLFSALDGMSDESLDDGTGDDDGGAEPPAADGDGDAGDDKGSDDDKDKPAETECAAAPATECATAPVTECGDAAPVDEPAATPVTECGDTAPVDEPAATPVPVDEPAATSVGDAEPAVESSADQSATPVVESTGNPASEPALESVDAKLESIKADYVEKLARERVRAITEAYDRKRALAEKRALCESIIANYQEGEAAKDRQIKVESTMNEKISELGDKVATLCESAMSNGVSKSTNVLDAKLESILNHVKSSKTLDAKLESILGKVKADRDIDAKLAAIVESVKTPKTVPEAAHQTTETAPKATLDAKLESIIANAKQKIAAAK